MEALKQLISILNKKRLSKIEILDRSFLSEKESLFTKFYEGIVNGSFTSDDDASMFLYQSDSKDLRYRKLKSRFKKRLINTLYFIDLNEYQPDTQSRIFFELSHIRGAINVLMKLGNSFLPNKLITDNFDKALKLGDLEVLKEFSFKLLVDHAVNMEAKDFFAELERFEKFQKASIKEYRAKILYYKSVIIFQKKYSNENILFLKEELEHLQASLDDDDSFQTFYSLNKAFLFYYENEVDVEKLRYYCDANEQLFLRFSTQVKSMQIGTNSLYKIKLLIAQRQFNEAYTLCANVEHLFQPKGNYNWMVIKEFSFLAALQNEDIPTATGILEEVAAQLKFKHSTSPIQEKWKIYEGYLVFLDEYLNKKPFKFNFAKLDNEVPTYSQDKSGFNFALRVLEILYQLAKRNFDDIIQRGDALRVYKNRYLHKNKQTLRSHAFIKLLIKMEKYDFDFAQLAKYESEDLTILKSTTNRFNSGEWEVIPYDRLWEIIIDILKK